MIMCCGLPVCNRDPCQKEITVCRSHGPRVMKNDVIVPGGTIYWLSSGPKEEVLI